MRTGFPGALRARFDVLAELESDGLGELYRVTERQSERRGVLRVVPTEIAGDDTERSRLKRELAKQALLKHDSLVTPFDSGEADASVWIFRPLIEAETLQTHLASGPLSLDQAAFVAAEVAAALDVLHRAGLLHRDLRPAHVLLPVDASRARKVLLVDPGAAPMFSFEARRVAGTVEYASPEQLSGKLVSFRSDLYALGCILFEMLHGRPPYLGSDTASIASAHLTAPLPAFDKSLFPSAIEKLLASLLAKDPRERPFSAQQVRRELEPFIQLVTPWKDASPVVQSPVEVRSSAMNTETEREKVAAQNPAQPPAATTQPRRSTPPPVPPQARRPSGAPPAPPVATASAEPAAPAMEPLEEQSTTVEARMDDISAPAIPVEPVREAVAPTNEEEDDAPNIEALAQLVGGRSSRPPPAPPGARPLATQLGMQPVEQSIAPTIAGVGLEAEAPAEVSAPARPRSVPPVPTRTLIGVAPVSRPLPPAPSTPPPPVEGEPAVASLPAPVAVASTPAFSIPQTIESAIAPAEIALSATPPSIAEEVLARMPEAQAQFQMPAAAPIPSQPITHPTPNGITAAFKSVPPAPTNSALKWLVLGALVIGIGGVAGLIFVALKFLGPATSTPPEAVTPAMQAPVPVAVAPTAELPSQPQPQAQPVAVAAPTQEPPAQEPAVQPAAQEPVMQEPAQAQPSPQPRQAREASHSAPRSNAASRETRAAQPAHAPAAQPASQPAPVNHGQQFDTVREQARAAFAQHRYPQAAAGYLRATQLNPNHAGSFAGLGASRLAMGDARGAVQAYQRAVQLSPQSSGFFAALGRAFAQLGDRPKAAAAYHRALSLDRNNAAAREGLQRLGEHPQ